MPVEFEEEKNQERWETAIKNVAEILQLDKDTVENYLVLVYDGTTELKVDTDLPDIGAIVSMTMVFLEHVSGKGVILVNEDGSRVS